MSQHDFFLDNATGASFRTDLNNALAAGVSLSSGASAPTTTYAYMWWADTTTGILKMRNAANDAWITVGKLSNLWDSPTLVTPALGTPSSGTVTNLTGTASININGTVGATTPAAGAFTTLKSSGNVLTGLSAGSTWSEGAIHELGFLGTALWGRDTNEIVLGSNFYYNGGWKYANSGVPSLTLQLQNGVFYFNHAAIGTAGNGITWSTPVTISSTGLAVTGTITGSTTIGVGNATPAASGAGITFPATQSASSDANTLDDYEEGTWTATYGASGSNTGHYTKIGREVKISVTLNNINQTFSSVAGIPFAVADIDAGSLARILGFSGFDRSNLGVGCLGTDLNLYDAAGAPAALISGAGTVRLDITATYRV